MRDRYKGTLIDSKKRNSFCFFFAQCLIRTRSSFDFYILAFNPKIYIAKFGPLNSAFSAWIWLKKTYLISSSSSSSSSASSSSSVTSIARVFLYLGYDDDHDYDHTDDHADNHYVDDNYDNDEIEDAGTNLGHDVKCVCHKSN